MMSNTLYWHIEVIEITHEKSSFGAIHKVENNYRSGFFGVGNEGLQLELSVDFVSFNRYSCRMGGLKHPVYTVIHSTKASILCWKYPFNFDRGFVDLWKQGFVESSCLVYFKRPVSHHHFFETSVCTPSTFLPSSTVYPLLILSVCRLFHGNPDKHQEIISYIKTRNKFNKGRYKTVCLGDKAKIWFSF